MRHVTVTTPISGIICHTEANILWLTCVKISIPQLQSFYSDWGLQNLNWAAACDPDHAPLRNGLFVIAGWDLYGHTSTKLEVSRPLSSFVTKMRQAMKNAPNTRQCVRIVSATVNN